MFNYSNHFATVDLISPVSGKNGSESHIGAGLRRKRGCKERERKGGGVA